MNNKVGLMSSPTSGYILDFSCGANPGVISAKEKEYLRDLAKRVVEISLGPQQEEKRNLWYNHNDLKKTRPMLLIFPENSWIEIIGMEQLEIKDYYWKQWEWYFKHLIYRHQNLNDDFVIEPDIYVNAVIQNSGWGLESKLIRPEDEHGSFCYDIVIKEPNDIKKLKYPVIEIDRKETQNRFNMVNDMFGDLLSVHINYLSKIDVNLITDATSLRGIEQIMVDIYDRPEWVHEFMSFLSDGILRTIKFFEKNGFLGLNNRNHYTDSGGIGYTHNLPSTDFDGKNVRLKDLWGFGVAQEFSEVGPVQHEEFLLNYQLRILEQCGLVSYGCCEPYTNKFDMIKRRIPQLRRVSVSTWCDTKKAVEALQDKYIYSWKPNPSMLIGDFNEDEIRAYIRKTLDATKECMLEIILKDTITLENKPERLKKWIQIAREEIEKLGI